MGICWNGVCVPKPPAPPRPPTEEKPENTPRQPKGACIPETDFGAVLDGKNCICPDLKTEDGKIVPRFPVELWQNPRTKRPHIGCAISEIHASVITREFLEKELERLRKEFQKEIKGLSDKLLDACKGKSIDECFGIDRFEAKLKEIADKFNQKYGELEALKKQVEDLIKETDKLQREMRTWMAAIDERITKLERKVQVDVGIEAGATFTGGTPWFEGRLVATLRFRVHDRVDLFLRGSLGLWARPQDRTALSVAGAGGVALWFDKDRRFGLLLGGIFSSRLIPGLQTTDEAQLNPALRSWMVGGMGEFRFYPTKMLYLFVDAKAGYTSSFLATPARLYRGFEGDLSGGLGLTF
jgi:phage host-nuclease inhibitor protein Gam